MAEHDDPVVEARMQEYVRKYNNGLRGTFFNERDVSRAETDRYAQDRGGLHLYNALVEVLKIKYGVNSAVASAVQAQMGRQR